MNGDVYSHTTQSGSSTIAHRTNYHHYPPSNPSNNTYRHSYSQAAHEPNLPLPQRKQPHTVNQRHLYMINLQQQQRQRSNLDIYNFRDRRLESSTSYYDRIHAQYRSNTSLNQSSNFTQASSNFQPSRETSPIVTNGPTQQIMSGTLTSKSAVSSPRPQVNQYRSKNSLIFLLLLSSHEYPIPLLLSINLHPVSQDILMNFQ